ncbi:MAG: hypothetical protein NZM06_02255, partial [Chloroherpetonaceae bacterium]|nr:hypothetical protein [Chloroherpetonaceae bacterium]
MIAQVQKLRSTHRLDDELAADLALLDEQRYADAVLRLQAYLQARQGVLRYVSPEAMALRFGVGGFGARMRGAFGGESRDESAARRVCASLRGEVGRVGSGDFVSPNDERRKAEYEEARQDYEAFDNAYDAQRRETVQELSDDEKASLKERCRKAIRLCHPDLCGEEATGMAQELNRAYQEQNLQAVTEILEKLESGGGLAPKRERLTEAEALRR